MRLATLTLVLLVALSLTAPARADFVAINDFAESGARTPNPSGNLNPPVLTGPAADGSYAIGGSPATSNGQLTYILGAAFKFAIAGTLPPLGARIDSAIVTVSFAAPTLIAGTSGTAYLGADQRSSMITPILASDFRGPGYTFGFQTYPLPGAQGGTYSIDVTRIVQSLYVDTFYANPNAALLMEFNNIGINTNINLYGRTALAGLRPTLAINYTPGVGPVPEPASFVLVALGLGLVGAGYATSGQARRRGPLPPQAG